MNKSILEIAKAMELNNAPGTFDENVEALNNEYAALQNLVGNGGYDKNIINAVFEYILNHHVFELDSIDKINTILGAVVEIACPSAQDDSRSTELLKHIQNQFKKRINEL